LIEKIRLASFISARFLVNHAPARVARARIRLARDESKKT